MTQRMPNEQTTHDRHKVWIVYSSSRHDHAQALCDYLRRRDQDANAVPMAEGLRDIARDRLGGGMEQIRKLFAQKSPLKLPSALDEWSAAPPRIVLVNRPENARALEHLRTWMQASFRIVAWIDDLESAKSWENMGADAVIAPTVPQLQHVVSSASSPLALRVGPSRPSAAELSDDARERARVAMDAQDEFVVMIDGSRMRPQDVPSWIAEIARRPDEQRRYRWLFYYGAHEQNAAAMRHAAKTYGFAGRMFGDTTPVEQVLPGIDALVTPAQSSVRDLCTWLPVHILSHFRVGRDATEHPLVRLERVHVLEGQHMVLDGLSRVRAADPPVSLSDAGDLVHAGDTPHIFQEIAAFIDRIAARDADGTEASGDATDRGAFAFEEIGPQSTSSSLEADLEALSPEQIRTELARVFKRLRALEREQEAAVQTRDLWMQRLQDAEDTREEDLISYAKERAHEALRMVATIQQQIVSVQDARDRLRVRRSDITTTGAVAPMESDDLAQRFEHRFEHLAQERRLRELRKRASLEDPGGGSSQ